MQQLYGEGDCHSWRGLGASPDGEGDHGLGLQEQVLAACNPQVQPAKCVCLRGGWGSVGPPGLVHPSFPSFSRAKTPPPPSLFSF